MIKAIRRGTESPGTTRCFRALDSTPGSEKDAALADLIDVLGEGE